MEAEAVHHIDSTVQQQRQGQQQQAQQHEGEIKIPRKLQPGHRALLAISRDETMGSNADSPNTMLNSWEEFKRHCDTSPLEPSPRVHQHLI